MKRLKRKKNNVHELKERDRKRKTEIKEIKIIMIKKERRIRTNDFINFSFLGFMAL